MALIFNTAINLTNGMTLENAYGRVVAVDGIQGTTVESQVVIFSSEEAFTTGKQPIFVETIKDVATTSYDRTTMGADILNIGHEALKASLAQQGYETTIAL